MRTALLSFFAIAVFATVAEGQEAACRTCAASLSLDAEQVRCVRTRIPALLGIPADPVLLVASCAPEGADEQRSNSDGVLIDPNTRAVRTEAPPVQSFVLRQRDVQCLSRRVASVAPGGRFEINFARDCR